MYSKSGHSQLCALNVQQNCLAGEEEAVEGDGSDHAGDGVSNPMGMFVENWTCPLPSSFSTFH